MSEKKIQLFYPKINSDSESELDSVSRVIFCEGTYINGKKNGLWKLFYPDSTIKYMGFYIDDVLHGKNVTWFQNGTIKQEGDYFEGYKNGEWKFYYENGSPKEIIFFKDTLPDGEYKSWFENNNVETEGKYKNGLPSGHWIHRYSNGKKKCEGLYFMGKRHAEWIFYKDDFAFSVTYNYNGDIGLGNNSTDPINRGSNIVGYVDHCNVINIPF